jgi:hypothetical protein
MKRTSLAVICLFTVLYATAQDKIHRKNGQVVNGKVLEVGSSEIKYRVGDSTEIMIYVLERDRINKIEYGTGRVERFAADLKDPEQYTGQLKKAIKVDFFGPLLGYSQITLEKTTNHEPGPERKICFGVRRLARVGTCKCKGVGALGRNHNISEP